MVRATVQSRTWHCLWLNNHSKKEPVHYAWPQNDASPWTQRRNQDDSSFCLLLVDFVYIVCETSKPWQGVEGSFQSYLLSWISNAIIHIQCTSQLYLDPAAVHVRKVKSSPRFCCCWLFNLEAIY